MSPKPVNDEWRNVRRWMHVAAPVNKGTVEAGAEEVARKLPQISSPVLIGALGLSALGAGVALRALRPARRSGRTDRFTDLVLEALAEDAAADAPARVVCVDVGEGFGKPSLVSVDVTVLPTDEAADPEVAAAVLEAVSRAVWNNPEIAPVAVRARVLLAKDEAGAEVRAEASAQVDVQDSDVDDEYREVADMTALGFDDEIARPADLFARYGAPASDPAWRP